jgi:hypothetical protein
MGNDIMIRVSVQDVCLKCKLKLTYTFTGSLDLKYFCNNEACDRYRLVAEPVEEW